LLKTYRSKAEYLLYENLPLKAVMGGTRIKPEPGVQETLTNKVQDLSSPSTDTYLSTQGIRTLFDTEVEVTKSESFDNFNARFLGEVGKPSENTPAWTDDNPTKVTTVIDTVFGVSKQVVKANQVVAFAGGTGAQLPLVAADWTNINSFGASYGGTVRLDTTNSAGFFMGFLY